MSEETLAGKQINRRAFLNQSATIAAGAAVLGSTARPLTRDRVRAGDALFVTGALGGPGAALDDFLRGERPNEKHRARFAASVGNRVHVEERRSRGAGDTEVPLRAAAT